MLKILKTTVQAGLPKPVKLLQITDTHLTRDDPTGWNRKGTFDVDGDGCAEAYFFEALRYAKQEHLPIVHTGDLIDFFSPGNFDFIDTYFQHTDYLYAADNHDFCHMLGQATEDTAYKWEQLRRIAPHLHSNLYFDSRLIGGLNVVTLDNSYYRITDGQLDMLKAEVAKGYPILLAMHVPFYTPTLFTQVEAGYLVGTPDDALATLPENRQIQQAVDDATRYAVEYITHEPAIKALITGHKHCNHEESLASGLIQYTTHGSFAGYVREVTVV